MKKNMKNEFLRLRNKYWHPSLSDWDILRFVTDYDGEVFIFMHNASISEDGKRLMLRGFYREEGVPFDEIMEISSEPGNPWSTRD